MAGMCPEGLETLRTADLEVGATCLRIGSKANIDLIALAARD